MLTYIEENEELKQKNERLVVENMNLKASNQDLRTENEEKDLEIYRLKKQLQNKKDTRADVEITLISINCK